ncbi:hypothetical protein CFP56_024251 [Quercus suber]|uniref:FLZ-type domain-containing protein n=1 Tax=Quercus suber TaxID=58331 RepID=A0AAW0MF97_QUESU
MLSLQPKALAWERHLHVQVFGIMGLFYFMIKGDRAFCSVECRCRQILMDEEESLHKDHCSLAAMKPTSSSSSSSSSARNHRKGTRNRAGGFVN